MRLGLIGCGGIGQLRAAALNQVDSLSLIAVNDLDLGRSTAIGSAYGAEVVRDWHDLVTQDTVDAVIVSTPPSLHAEMCIEALRAGKHVLCEKPLARTPEECRQIVEAAQEYGRFVATGFNYRFYPSITKARELFDEGIIGELDHIRSYTGYSATEHNHPWLHDVEVMGGGALWDNGTHLIDLTCYFLGDVAEVKGQTTNWVWGFEGCEDNGFALLCNSAGRVALVQASWTEWRGYRLLVEIYGTQGCIRTWCFPMRTEVVWSHERGGPTRKRNYWFPKTFVMEHLRSYRWVVTESFVHEFLAFREAVEGRPSAVATGSDGSLAIEIAHAASHPPTGTVLNRGHNA